MIKFQRYRTVFIFKKLNEQLNDRKAVKIE